MTISPYNQETCQTFSSFQAPHQPCYGQLMFNHVQLGYGGYGWPGRLLVTLCQAYFPELVRRNELQLSFDLLQVELWSSLNNRKH